MQINQQELDVQFVELLPERETLFFHFNGNALQSNTFEFTLSQTANTAAINGDASGGNSADFDFSQSNSNSNSTED